MKTLEFNNTEKISYCISNELRDVQIKINCKKVTGRLVPSDQLFPDRVAVVCFGPSLQHTWEQLKDFDKIITCSGAHKFLIDKGIIPTWHADLEPREHKIAMLGTPQKETEYLIASTVHPRYFDQLEGYNVKLWHIFASDEEAASVLPRGEWHLTGGSSIGLRCMTLMRFLGYTDLHIFGMDGSYEGDASHTTTHPNAPKEARETEYNGKKYATTGSMLYCAKETFKELNQLKDVRATFYGEGLVQDMFKDYVKQEIKGQPTIAFNPALLISDEKRALDAKLHRDHPTYGMGGAKHAPHILQLAKELNTTKVLDYGAGKRQLAKALKPHFPIWEYDPAIEEIATVPGPADIVACTDVLEHIEPDRLNFVLEDLQRVVQGVGYFVISTRKAVKTYSNGANTHSIVKDADWWTKKLQKYFMIANVVEKKDASEVHIFVKKKIKGQEDITIMEVNQDGLKGKFYVPNQVTKWRAESIFTKEPSTIQWIKEMQKGEILFDVGANIGSYTILAGVKGVKVYAFEPEADNYALLIKNMNLNGLEPNAYPVAISDKRDISFLFEGQKGAGGACHSFGQEVGPDIKERKAATRQGCMAFPLDSFIDMGLPAPHHLKIDVDGFEDKVIAGAMNILANGLKTILIEINPKIESHVKLVDWLQHQGFEFDPVQVDAARRKEGAFEGVAEHIFYKKKATPLIKHICRRIEDTPLKTSPFKYLYVENVFTENIYRKIVENMPTEYIEIEKSRNLKGYPQRFTAKLNDNMTTIGEQLLSGEFMNAILKKFDIEYSPHFTQDILMIRDLPGYSIPPHTDTPAKVISVLFYLPEDNSMEDEGTGIYLPKNPKFTSPEGKHLNFDDFVQVALARFRPNSCLIFQRTDNSFHGVPPCKHIRNVLLYNIKTTYVKSTLTTTTNE